MKKMIKKSGFTLVEIMIVVAIIGLLAAIGIPSFQKARANALEKSKENNVRMIETAVEQWAMDQGLTNDSDVSGWTTNTVSEYIKGGLDALTVGNGTNDENTVELSEINALTVGEVLEVSDFY
ncbi:type II secretion system protein [Kiritimatiella glycovorans]|uniref:General secretion pathway protein G n=1 Tax=Kiritimatiella glycovorans TaxID=1307763 RepID=A0A0G3EBT1_9BACT|nr:type II secretion system protein [Kiritimatiella glycovorans]AKJ63763.1 General secretion pathway protein G [Kiritimatiella glycovorans]